MFYTGEWLSGRHVYPEQLALDEIDSHTALIVVDTNRPSYTECPNLLNRAKAIVVFDHHRQCEDVVKNAVLSYTEPYASSTCEMIAEVLQYFDEDINFPHRSRCYLCGNFD